MKADIGLLVLRLGLGGIMLFAHGQAKLFNFTIYASKFPDPLGIGAKTSLALAVFSEFFCSIALMAGLKTRWVAAPLLVTMLVAAFIVHAADPFKTQELSILYAVGYLTLMLTGGGKLSLDGVFNKSSLY